MKIIIAGAGSVGLLLGSFLAEAGMNVTMFVRRKEQADLINAEGIRRINLDGTESTFKVEATTELSKKLHTYPWIVAVKFSSLNELLAEMMEADVNDPIMFVQNGIGHMDLAYATTFPNISFSTVEHGAQRLDDRTVSHNGAGMLTIAVGRGEKTLYNEIICLNSGRFPVVYHDNAEEILMRKVLVNCMINPLTAILGVKNGELLTNSYCNELFKSLYKELMSSFTSIQSSLSYEDVVTICENTSLNTSSMLTDRLAGRPMEIETIVTAVIQTANANGSTLPLLSTLEKMLYALDSRENKL